MAELPSRSTDRSPSAPDDDRDLRLALLWQVRPSGLRAVRRWVASGAIPFPWSEADLERMGSGFSDGLRGELGRLPGPEDAARVRGEMERLSIAFLRDQDEAFPDSLREIADPPPFLFVRGDPWGQPERPRIGVVGARAASATGREIAYTLARDLALAGCVVVSGLARGVDGEAHRGALEAGGKSVAVLGTGADICYPAEHQPMFRQILERGGLVSEFPPGTPPRPLHFPRRNRILAALCDVLILVEGSEKSGARSTVDFALEQGREVMAVPRDIVHPGAALPNRLLRDGAAPVTCIQDVLDLVPRWRAHLRAAGAEGDAVSGDGGQLERSGGQAAATAEGDATAARRSWEGLLWESLGRSGVRLDEILPHLPAADVALVQACLARWEILGQVKRLPGGRWTRTRTSGDGRERAKGEPLGGAC